MLYINAHINDFEPTAEVVREARKKIKFRCDLSGSTMIDVLVGRGWTQVAEDDDSWHLYWNDVNKTAEILDSRQFESHQKIPHFRNHFELTRKNLLAKNLRHYKRYLKRQKCNRDEMAEIMPRTYEIPSEYSKFLADFDKSLGITWILKPASGRQGSGIFLFQDLKDLDEWREDLTSTDDQGKTLTAKKSNQRIRRPDTIELPGVYVVQKYVERPYLIDSKKFDLRFYVLVTSWCPLIVWMSRDGFARICGSKYSLENLRANRVHLTNMAIQLRPGSQVDSVPGTKWKMQKLKSFLAAQHGLRATDELMERIAALVMTSLRSVAKRIRPDERCFELYGYDVLLDEKLKPWLLEVNASPSLNATGPEDYRMKYDLLSDVVNIIDFENTFTGFEGRIGGFDLVWKDGPVLTLRDAEDNEGDYDKIIGVAGAYSVTDASYPDRRLNAYLGEPNNRVEQLAILKFQRQVAKVMASLPSEPLWAPSDAVAALPVPDDFQPVVDSEDGGEIHSCDPVTGGDLLQEPLAPEKLVWDKATVAKVSDENLYGFPRKACAKEDVQGKSATVKLYSGSEPDEQDGFWNRNVCRKAVGKKMAKGKVATRKPELGKAIAKKVGCEKVTACKVASKKSGVTKAEGGKVASSKTVGGNVITCKDTNEELTSSVVSDKAITSLEDSDRKTSDKGDETCESMRVRPLRQSDLRKTSDNSESSDSASETSDESGSENSRENSSENSSPNSTSRLSPKMFGMSGLGTWCPRLAGK